MSSRRNQEAMDTASTPTTIPMILIDIGARSRANSRGGVWRSAAIDIEGGRTVMSLQAFLRDRDTLLAGGARPVEIDPVYMGTYSLDSKSHSIVPKYQYASMLLRHVWVAIGPSVYLVDFLVVDGAYYDFVLGADFVHKLDGRYPWQRSGEWMVGTSDRSIKLDFSDDVWLKPGEHPRPAPLWRVPAARAVPPTYNPSYEVLTVEAEFLPVFRALDTDHDGFVSRAELRQAMKNPWGGAPLVESEFRAVWEQVDPYGTGYLNQEQFLQLMGQFRGFFHSPSPYQHAAMSHYRPAAQPPAGQYAQYAVPPEAPAHQGAPLPSRTPETSAASYSQHAAEPCAHCHQTSPHSGHGAPHLHSHVSTCCAHPLTTTSTSTTTTTTTTTYAPPPPHPQHAAHAPQDIRPQSYQPLPAHPPPPTTTSTMTYHQQPSHTAYGAPALTSQYQKPPTTKSYVQHTTNPQSVFYSKPYPPPQVQPASFAQTQASSPAVQQAYSSQPQYATSLYRPQASSTVTSLPASPSQIPAAPHTYSQYSPQQTTNSQPFSRPHASSTVTSLPASPSQVPAVPHTYSQYSPQQTTNSQPLAQPLRTNATYISQPQRPDSQFSSLPPSSYSQSSKPQSTYTGDMMRPPNPNIQPQRPIAQYAPNPPNTSSQHQSQTPGTYTEYILTPASSTYPQQTSSQQPQASAYTQAKASNPPSSIPPTQPQTNTYYAQSTSPSLPQNMQSYHTIHTVHPTLSR